MPDAALAEETGVTAVALKGSLGQWRRVVGAASDETGELEQHVWDVFHLEPTAPLLAQWQDRARGSTDEAGLVFMCRWIPLRDARTALHPLFGPVVDLLPRERSRDPGSG